MQLQNLCAGFSLVFLATSILLCVDSLSMENTSVKSAEYNRACDDADLDRLSYVKKAQSAELFAGFQAGMLAGCIPVYSAPKVAEGIYDAIKRGDYLGSASFAMGHALGLLIASVALYGTLTTIAKVPVSDLLYVSAYIAGRTMKETDMVLRLLGFFCLYGIYKASAVFLSYVDLKTILVLACAFYAVTRVLRADTKSKKVRHRLYFP